MKIEFDKKIERVIRIILWIFILKMILGVLIFGGLIVYLISSLTPIISIQPQQPIVVPSGSIEVCTNSNIILTSCRIKGEVYLNNQLKYNFTEERNVFNIRNEDKIRIRTPQNKEYNLTFNYCRQGLYLIDGQIIDPEINKGIKLC